MSHHHVAVLVLGYNHRDTLLDTLKYATAQSYAPYEVIYIDNASQDNSIEIVEKNYPHIRILKNTKNLGYAGGYKQALSTIFQEEFDTAVLLNPDTVVDSDWLTELVASAYANNQIAFAQPKIYLWENGKTSVFNTAGNKIHFLGVGYCGRYKEKDEPPIEKDIEIPYASGASLLVKKEIYRKLPGFDNRFFAYLEDQDLGWQARMLGYTSVLSAKSKMWHKYDFDKKSLSNFKLYLLERNRFFFLLKNFECKTLILISPALLLLEGGILLHSIINGYFWKKLLAYKDFFASVPGVLKDRRHIQTIRTKTDRELFPFLSPEIQFDEINSPLLSLANQFLKWYYTCIRRMF